MSEFVSLVAFALGLAAGAGGLAWLRHGEMRYLRAELSIAQDRLLHAWRDDKAIIPPRPQPAPEPPLPLPPELQELVDDWESPAAQQAAAAKYRDLYFVKGWGVPAILRQAEDNHTGSP